MTRRGVGEWRHHMRWQNYSGLVYGWLGENRAPHTNWSASREKVHEVSETRAAGSHAGPVDLSRSDAGLSNTR